MPTSAGPKKILPKVAETMKMARETFKNADSVAQAVRTSHIYFADSNAAYIACCGSYSYFPVSTLSTTTLCSRSQTPSVVWLPPASAFLLVAGQKITEGDDTFAKIPAEAAEGRLRTRKHARVVAITLSRVRDKK
jgi:hypothetical protein